MTIPETGWLPLAALSVSLGLLGFIEPCSLGSSLVFIKTLEGRAAAAKIAQTGVFTATRALLMGALGWAAAAMGTVLFTFQKAVWVVFGMLYIVLGFIYLAGKGGLLMSRLGSRLPRVSGLRGAAALGAVFALNIPACATPLLLALLGVSTAHGAAGAAPGGGFATLALFGLALSMPLVVLVLFEPARRLIDGLAGLSRRIPLWTGLVLTALGVWSIGLGLFSRSAVPS